MADMTTGLGATVAVSTSALQAQQARIDYEAAIDFYQQSMNLITTAARAPGKG